MDSSTTIKNFLNRVHRRRKGVRLFQGLLQLLTLALAGALAAIDLRFSSLFLASFWALPLFPAFLLVSIARFNLYDVDRILSATASYNILAVLLGGGALLVVPRIAEAVAGVAGLDPGISQIAISSASPTSSSSITALTCSAASGTSQVTPERAAIANGRCS